MGNSSVSITTIGNKFVQTLDDQHFGSVQIYLNETGRFIMKERRTFIKNLTDNRYLEFKQLLAFIKNCESSRHYSNYFVPILCSSASQQNNLCIVHQIFETYTEYYNFTLEDMVKNDKQLQIEQIWMCLRWLLELILILEKQNWTINGVLDMSKIFITLKGKPILYYHHICKNINDNQQTHLKEIMQQNANILNNNNIPNVSYFKLIRESALMILSIVSKQKIKQNSNIIDQLNKLKQMDNVLGTLLEDIITLNLDSQNCCTAEDLLKMINYWVKEQKIIISKEIKLNKFKCSRKSQKPQFQDLRIEKPQSQSIKCKQLHGKSNRNQLKKLKQKFSQKMPENIKICHKLQPNLSFKQNIKQRNSFISEKGIKDYSQKININSYSQKVTDKFNQNRSIDQRYYMKKSQGNKNVNLIENSIHNVSTSFQRSLLQKSTGGRILASKAKIV